MKLVEDFEKWYIEQFGEDKKLLLSMDANQIYSDEIVNAMWIGFCAGRFTI